MRSVQSCRHKRIDYSVTSSSLSIVTSSALSIVTSSSLSLDVRHAMQSPFRRAAPAPAPAPMPMLSFPGKRPQRFADDTSAAEKDRDLEAFMRSRRLVVLSSERGPKAAGGGEQVAADLRAYLRELDAVTPRFDAAVKRATLTAPQKQLGFAWRDAAGARGRQSHTTSLATERAVAMFALAAEESRAAAAEDRRGADGIRRSCAALCDAAGALGAAVSGGHADAASDQLCHLSSACILAFKRLMLVQALECYFELAVAGGKPPALCSKVAQQVSLDYGQVHIALESAYLQQQQQIDKSWAPHVQAKAAYFRAEACLRYAQALREQGDVGEAIARLRLGLASLESAKRPIKKAAAAVQDAVKWLRKETEAELCSAEQDNCRIYYMRVPAADALAELPALPQPLVRPTPVDKILLQGSDAAATATAKR